VITNLMPPNWTLVAGSLNNASSNSATVTDTNRYGGQRRFYHAVSP